MRTWSLLSVLALAFMVTACGGAPSVPEIPQANAQVMEFPTVAPLPGELIVGQPTSFPTSCPDGTPVNVEITLLSESIMSDEPAGALQTNHGTELHDEETGDVIETTYEYRLEGGGNMPGNYCGQVVKIGDFTGQISEIGSGDTAGRAVHWFFTVANPLMPIPE